LAISLSLPFARTSDSNPPTRLKQRKFTPGWSIWQRSLHDAGSITNDDGAMMDAVRGAATMVVARRCGRLDRQVPTTAWCRPMQGSPPQTGGDAGMACGGAGD
jgi:hypothetical protein